MALQFVGGFAYGEDVVATYNVDLTSLTGGLASSPATGDLVIVCTMINLTGAVGTENVGVTTSGYTEIAHLFEDDSNDCLMSVAWKIMGGTPDTSLTVYGPNIVGRTGRTTVHVWRGADQTTPIDVTTTTATSISSTDINSPTITPTTSGAVVISAGASAGDSLANVSSSAISGYSNIFTSSADPSRSGASVIASKAWTSGAEDPPAWTGQTTTATGCWCAATVAIRPGASSNIKTINGLTYANTKTVNGLAIASVKNFNGLA